MFQAGSALVVSLLGAFHDVFSAFRSGLGVNAHQEAAVASDLVDQIFAIPG